MSAGERGSGPHRLSDHAPREVPIRCSGDYEDIRIGAGSLNFYQQILTSLDVLGPRPHPSPHLTKESVEVSSGVYGLPRVGA